MSAFTIFAEWNGVVKIKGWNSSIEAWAHSKELHVVLCFFFARFTVDYYETLCFLELTFTIDFRLVNKIMGLYYWLVSTLIRRKRKTILNLMGFWIFNTSRFGILWLSCHYVSLRRWIFFCHSPRMLSSIQRIWRRCCDILTWILALAKHKFFHRAP